jgi:hypothetical protein
MRVREDKILAVLNEPAIASATAGRLLSKTEAVNAFSSDEVPD